MRRASPAWQRLQDALALPVDERLELASDIVDWDAGGLAEIDGRVQAAMTRGESGSDWAEARARISKRLA